MIIPKGVPIRKESGWNDPSHQDPVKTFFTVSNANNFADEERCPGNQRYVCWPTISPSSVTYYPSDGKITRWRNSLLITSLKNGQLYRVPLNSDMRSVQGDAETYFHSDNRYRAVLVDRQDTRRIFIATDVRENVMGSDGKATAFLANPGSILEIVAIAR